MAHIAPMSPVSALRSLYLVSFVALLLLGPGTISVPAQTSSPAGTLQSITPGAGRAGDAVTITGVGFGARNVQITVAGRTANVVTATGTSATFIVPPGVPPGVAAVVVTNPGGRSGSIGFRVLEGILLPASPTGAARDALHPTPPSAAAAADIDPAGIILTRLDVRIAPEATTAEINDALRAVDGGIVGMQPGVLTLVVAVPRAGSAGDLHALAAQLAARPGIRAAYAGQQPRADVLPFVPTASVPTLPSLQNVEAIHHLLPARFPAAWNAAGADQRLLEGCRPVPVLVQDFFGQIGTGWLAEFTDIGSFASDGTTQTHGFDVLTALGANFDTGALTGANPFQQCLDLRPLSARGLSFSGIALQLASELAALPSGKSVLNQSLGFIDDCSSCAPGTIASTLLGGLARAYHTLTWKEATHTWWNDFAAAVSGGNDASLPLSQIYVAFGDATLGSPASVSTTNDKLLTFAGQGGLYVPPPTRPEFPSLAASTDELVALAADVRAAGLDTVPEARNVVIVGSTTAGVEPLALTRSSFSEAGAQVHAVGECVVFDIDAPGRCENGTSFAAPQVAGLLSYLWLLSPELRDTRPASDAANAIRENARRTTSGHDTVDAYAAVLSLDGAATPPTPATAPIRLALLDVDGNGAFTHDDVGTFVLQYFAAAEVPVEPVVREYSQFDLNGDGFTGGSGTERFDLDRVGSVQYGRSSYNAVEFDLGGVRVQMDENAVTDLQIVCYYAYSALYTGSITTRDSLLANSCAPITVTVDPVSVTLSAAGTQQFSANVRGTTDPRVTWLLPNGGGTITANGLFTAGASAGTYVVRAISLVDPGAFADASVTIAGTADVLAGTLTRHAHRTYAPGLSTDTQVSVTVRFEALPRNEPSDIPQFRLLSISGTGIHTAEASSGCNREPEVRRGTAVSARLDISPDLLVATLRLGFTGTSTHTSCTNPTVTTTFTNSSLPEGTFTGTPVVVDGKVIAIDFNRSESGPQVVVQQGRLSP